MKYYIMPLTKKKEGKSMSDTCKQDLERQCNTILEELKKAYEPNTLELLLDGASPTSLDELKVTIEGDGWTITSEETDEEGKTWLELADEEDSGITARISYDTDGYWDIEHEDDRGGLYNWINKQLEVNEWRLFGDKTYKSAAILCTFGGPNIYVDTGTKYVEGHWGCDEIKLPIPYDICDALDEILEDIYGE
jgi:hypothetical protein